MFAFELDSVYNFNTRAPAILGADFKKATILGILNYKLASNYINPETSHANIFPYLPEGTPKDPKSYTYILIRTESGENTVLAMPWIDETSITLVVNKTLVITVNDITNNDATRIRDNLLMMGFTSFNIAVN